MKKIALLSLVTALTLGAFFAIAKLQGTQAQTDFTNKVNIYEKDGYRYVESNGIPDHETGKFPNPHNPNRISEQNHQYKMPLTPVISTETDRQQGPPPPPPDGGSNDQGRGERRGPPGGGPPGGGGPWMGVALNGIPFDPGTGEAWNNDMRSGWNYEALTGKLNLGADRSNAHVQPTGTYHYHGIPVGLVEKLAGKQIGKKMILVGYGGDGFPLYSEYGYAKPNDARSGIKKLRPSYRLKSGTRPDGPKGSYDGSFGQDFEYVEGLGDLDRFNGRTGVTPEYPNGTYYYVITDSYPFMARSFKGVADKSFQKGPPQGGRGNGGPPSGGQRPPRRPL